MSATAPTALRLTGLTVELRRSARRIVDGVDLEVGKGEILGLVGESGSGKTTTATGLLGFASAGARITAGKIEVFDRELDASRIERGLRGEVVSFVPQNPGTSLNPSLRVAAAIRDMVDAHRPAAGRERRRPADVLRSVGLPDGEEFGRRYPHQISGGQQQRVCIGIALAADPPVVVLDEPTTGLDVITQAQVMAELARLRAEQEVAMVYVTHDLALISQVADRIAVMYAGQLVEVGETAEVLRAPRHPYTAGLIRSIPDHRARREPEPMPGTAVGVEDRPRGCAFLPRCPIADPRAREEMPELVAAAPGHLVRCFVLGPKAGAEPATATAATPSPTPPVSCEPFLEVSGLRAAHRGRGRELVVADDVSFTVGRGACMALVGESGSGKTTIARVVAGLHPASDGRLTLDGEPLPDSFRRRSPEQLRRVQLISQNPADSLNPRHTVAQALTRPLKLLRGVPRAELRGEIDRLLRDVRLPESVAERYPPQLSGGERQRVAIARAIAAGADLLVCDEVTSALDVSVQASVLALLRQMQRERQVSLLFITHNLGVVATIADQTAVLDKGRIVELGETRRVLDHPEHPYTRKLLEAAPSLSHAIADGVA